MMRGAGGVLFGRIGASRVHLIARLALGLGTLAFLLLSPHIGLHFDRGGAGRAEALLIASGIGLVLSLTPSLLSVLSRQSGQMRGMTGDFIMLGAAMLVAEHAMAWLYVLMVWVPISAGLRFGRRYLLYGMGLATATFAVVVSLSPFWQSIYWLTIGLAFGLLAIPAYFWAVITALANARDAAEKADQAKGRFLANMSHEFRTPLNGILGMSDLMAGCDIPVEARGYLEGIQGSARGLGSLVQHLLDFASIEAGRIRVTPDVFSVAAVVERVMSTVRPVLLQKGLEERVCVADNVPAEVYGDSEHARRALLSLVCNAAKFTVKGRVEVHVSMQHRGDALQMLCFRIRDTGPGFSEEIGARIFEPFRQADDSRSRETEGTGLGTAIAKGLVEANQGEIGYRSTLGVGTEFWFTFAVSPVPAELVGSSRTTPTEALGVSVVARPLRILVVDDHLTNRVVAETILRKAGHLPHAVGSGREAIDYLSQEWADFALLDLHMPGLSGLEVTRWIRAEEVRNALDPMPVMLLTADGTEQARTDAMISGVTGVLTKPISMIDLVRHVGNVGASSPVLATPAEACGRFLDDLRTSMENDAAFLSYLDSGVGDARNCLQQLGEALRSGDLTDASNAAHALKGVCSNLGLEPMAAVCADIEQHCRRREPLGRAPAEVLTQLQRQFDDGIRQINHRFRPTRKTG